MVNFKNKTKYDFEDMLEIMRILRGENGCPWDREQTHESIRKNFIEEVYEACEAIDLKNDAMLCEELGDVLFQVLINSQIAAEIKAFSIDDVVDGICRKMVRRHPHVFGDAKVQTAEEGTALWNYIKMQEKAKKP